MAVCPPCLHDGSPWGECDAGRSRLANAPIGVRGVLAEVRGDWVCYKSAFRLPAHNALQGCCWRCTVTPAGIRDIGLDDPWRQPEERLSHWAQAERIVQSGQSLSPLFVLPAFRSSCLFAGLVPRCGPGHRSRFPGPAVLDAAAQAP